MATTHAQRRLTKHELKQDAFTTAIFSAREWIENNMQSALIALGAVVVVVAGVWGFFAWRSSQAETANILFGQAGVEMRSGNPPAAIAQFQKLLDEYPSSRIAGLGCFELAQLQFRQRSFDEARVLYQRYIDEYGDDPLLVASAWAGQGAVDEQAGFYTEAVPKYERAYESDPKGYSAAGYLRRVVRCAIAANDTAKALAAYETLRAEFPRDATNTNGAKQALIEHGFLDPNTVTL